jgi:hypothetical protein
LAIVVTLFFGLPFSPWINLMIAATFWIIDAAIVEFMFRQKATPEQRVDGSEKSKS